MKNLPKTLSPLQKRILRRLKSLQDGSRYAETSLKELADYVKHKNRSSVQRAIINLTRKGKIEIIESGGSRMAGGNYQKSKIAVLQ
jgi:SOS-response transcriptional repressor LexA